MLADLNAAGASDSDINKITWENSCRFFGWDPFARTPKEQATVAALRAKATDVDVSIRPRKEWARLYEQKQLAQREPLLVRDRLPEKVAVYPLPTTLDSQLPPLPRGYGRVIVGRDVVLLDRRSHTVVDIMREVVR